MDYLDTLLGAGIAGIFYVLGKRSKPKYKDPKPICGCDHHFSFHDEDGCGYDEYGSHTGWRHQKCGCKKYAGPIPIDSYTAEA